MDYKAMLQRLVDAGMHPLKAYNLIVETYKLGVEARRQLVKGVMR